MRDQTGGSQAKKLEVTKIVGIDGACLRVEMSGLGQVLMPGDLFTRACKDAPKLWAEYAKPLNSDFVTSFTWEQPDKKPKELADERTQKPAEMEAKLRRRDERMRSKKLRRRIRTLSYKE